MTRESSSTWTQLDLRQRYMRVSAAPSGDERGHNSITSGAGRGAEAVSLSAISMSPQEHIQQEHGLGKEVRRNPPVSAASASSVDISPFVHDPSLLFVSDDRDPANHVAKREAVKPEEVVYVMKWVSSQTVLNKKRRLALGEEEEDDESRNLSRNTNTTVTTTSATGSSTEGSAIGGGGGDTVPSSGPSVNTSGCNTEGNEGGKREEKEEPQEKFLLRYRNTVAEEDFLRYLGQDNSIPILQLILVLMGSAFGISFLMTIMFVGKDFERALVCAVASWAGFLALRLEIRHQRRVKLFPSAYEEAKEGTAEMEEEDVYIFVGRKFEFAELIPMQQRTAEIVSSKRIELISLFALSAVSITWALSEYASLESRPNFYSLHPSATDEELHLASVVSFTAYPMLFVCLWIFIQRPRFVFFIVMCPIFVSAMYLGRFIAADDTEHQMGMKIILQVVVLSMLCLLKYGYEQVQRRQFEGFIQLHEAYSRSKLLNASHKKYSDSVLPPAIQGKLLGPLSKIQQFAEVKECATCILLDIFDFSNLASSLLLPSQTALMLATLDSVLFLQLCAKENDDPGVHRVYSVGDTFCAACNLLTVNETTHALRCMEFVLSVIDTILPAISAYAQFVIPLRFSISTGQLVGFASRGAHTSYKMFGAGFVEARANIQLLEGPGIIINGSHLQRLQFESTASQFMTQNEEVDSTSRINNSVLARFGVVPFESASTVDDPLMPTGGTEAGIMQQRVSSSSFASPSTGPFLVTDELLLKQAMIEAYRNRESDMDVPGMEKRETTVETNDAEDTLGVATVTKQEEAFLPERFETFSGGCCCVGHRFVDSEVQQEYITGKIDESLLKVGRGMLYLGLLTITLLITHFAGGSSSYVNSSDGTTTRASETTGITLVALSIFCSFGTWLATSFKAGFVSANRVVLGIIATVIYVTPILIWYGAALMRHSISTTDTEYFFCLWTVIYPWIPFPVDTGFILPYAGLILHFMFFIYSMLLNGGLLHDLAVLGSGSVVAMMMLMYRHLNVAGMRTFTMMRILDGKREAIEDNNKLRLELIHSMIPPMLVHDALNSVHLDEVLVLHREMAVAMIRLDSLVHLDTSGLSGGSGDGTARLVETISGTKNYIDDAFAKASSISNSFSLFQAHASGDEMTFLSGMGSKAAQGRTNLEEEGFMGMIEMSWFLQELLHQPFPPQPDDDDDKSTGMLVGSHHPRVSVKNEESSKKRVLLSLVATVETTECMLVNELYPTFEVFGVSIHRSRALLSAATAGTKIVTESFLRTYRHASEYKEKLLASGDSSDRFMKILMKRLNGDEAKLEGAVVGRRVAKKATESDQGPLNFGQGTPWRIRGAGSIVVYALI